MNGADKLCDVLLVNGVDVCFANPGTSEMHFVAALDRKPEMRCVLGLFEGVVTGAADGYARMADKPAATLLHLGPGLANGLANLHNARRADTPVLNVVGDHATYHLAYDAPLTSDIESLAQPMSKWVGRAQTAGDVRRVTEEAYVASVSRRGVSTMILPADAAWGEVEQEDLTRAAVPVAEPAVAGQLHAAAVALKSGKRVAMILAGKALRSDALEVAGKIAAATGASLFSQQSDRHERGAGSVAIKGVPYPVGMAVAALAEFEVAICLGKPAPVAFFAYPDMPSSLLPADCEAIELGSASTDLLETLKLLCSEVGAGSATPVTNPFVQNEIAEPEGDLTPDTIGQALARRLPENAIVCDEAITSGGGFGKFAAGVHVHDHLSLTGGAIGIGVPLSVGAAIACPDRKTILLQADGSGMYTLQGLWTQARENLDVVTIVYSNRSYAILQGEMRNVGVNQFGKNARAMLDLDRPELDWCLMARGMGVEAGRATTIEEFVRLLDSALANKGPFLIEAMI
ncbi:acetolactate synthase large subunit [Sulfitobacter sp. F26204]|uniref:acetolactate synthase large subunit n=1 Tax=Sulfitobacter sp. F26204 TaxID=2996014 RepID=UPI00225E1311|nr:acetolactate synthase large subunit [Sulfitobacter sp. F26204]MCX7560988.1 acetolactate synthase large subunit [Sulfitobacter sp. F26204]